MKKINCNALLGLIMVTVFAAGCGSKKDPARTYMPDMAYSRAYETYAMRDTTLFTTDAAKRGGNIIFYNNMPVTGTLKRGDLYPYTMVNDTNGYKMSAVVKNPLDTISKEALAEAGRLYNINCAICHGEKGTADGPIAGKIGAVANFTQPAIAALSDGTMFHVITYGRNMMGSYAAQLSKEQRWQVIKYIRTLQKPKGTATDSTVKKGADSTAVVKK